MAKKKKARKKTRRRAAGRRKSDQRQPGWVYLLTGLAIGLAIAGYVYVSDLPPPEELTASAGKQAKAALKATKEAAAKAEQKVEIVVEESVEEAEEFEYDFYNMLPNLDVEVYEDPKQPVLKRPVAAKPQAPVTAPGIYILQAGSFTSVEDANRRKAEMALRGVRAEIKRGQAGNKTVYRVYTDPMDNPSEVNRVSKLLTDANIEILRKRVTD